MYLLRDLRELPVMGAALEGRHSWHNAAARDSLATAEAASNLRKGQGGRLQRRPLSR